MTRAKMKPGTVFVTNGKKYVKTEKSYALYWSQYMLHDLKKYYADTPNEELADLLGVSWRSVIRKARELGLTKSARFMHDCSRRGLAIANVMQHTHTFRRGSLNGRPFPKGHKPATMRAVVRLDTMQEYESSAALAIDLGTSSSNVLRAAHNYGRACGVRVMFRDVWQRLEERRKEERNKEYKR